MPIAFKERLWTVIVLCLFIHIASVNGQSMQYAGSDEFTIAVLPDTQYYTAESRGASNDMFKAQTQWIHENAKKEKIAYVIHLGDITDHGETYPKEWENAAEAIYQLEIPQAGYPYGIPYGLAVGNHDQTKSQFPLSGKTDHYNHYFGVDHFRDKPWYGGHYLENNDSHYDLFEAGGQKFIVIYFEYDSYDENIEPLNQWASELLEKYDDHEAILVSHSIIHLNTTPGTNEKGFPKFMKQGQRIFDELKNFPNVRLLLSGHVGDNGEAYRQDGYAGNVIKSILTDYQSRENGGHGLMRLMKFSSSKDLIHCTTFSPYTGEVESDADSDFTIPWKHHTTVSRTMDFDNDQLTDIVHFDNGKWTIGSNSRKLSLGEQRDVPVPADYNGDGKLEAAVFRPSTGEFILESGRSISLGMEGDIPVCGDYDGDGFADLAVYRPSNFTWYFETLDSVKFGRKDVIPVPADYDGDGKIDLGFFRISDGMWQTALGNIPLQLSQPQGDIPLPGDYDGDGKAEMAQYRPSTGEWFIGFDPPIKFGQQGDIPVPGNYSRGGKLQPAVYRNGKIHLMNGQEVPFTAPSNAQLVNIRIVIHHYFETLLNQKD
ncbi:metallophosphoesterase [Echinicola sp. CAU 1574]|uniref:Metallophosphoesterase n=1 Tax=Echinicola arenosa TaxID=2774144 RepID=A0ABR9AGK0_9BACT|nr:metallophosphoesterase [Echinicola arenosa]MBD8487371.1 metallophosphoesterase [Echinicola arenosa]